METKTQVYLGLNDRNGKLVDCQPVMKLIRLLLNGLEGYTIQEAQGCWKHNREATLIISYVGQDSSDLLVLADAYKQKFNQESVMIETSEVNVQFN